MGINTGNH